jgi:hypothetical protein
VLLKIKSLQKFGSGDFQIEIAFLSTGKKEIEKGPLATNY